MCALPGSSLLDDLKSGSNATVNVLPLKPLSSVVLDETSTKVAIIVVHGMGQQVPFETIDGVARLIRDHNKDNCVREGAKDIHCGFVQLDDQTIAARAELELQTSTDNRTIHIYEGYWAPHTEGRIGILQVVTFCLYSIWQGWGFCRAGKFNRFVFNQWKDFSIKKGSQLAFLIALIFFIGFFASNFFIFTILGTLLTTDRINTSLFHALTQDLALIAGPAVLLFLSHWSLSKTVFKPSKPDTIQKGRKRTMAETIATFSFSWAIGLTVLFTLVSAILMGFHLLTRVAFLEQSTTPPALISYIPAIILWVIAVALSYVIRQFVIQYLGDVAIYLSSYRVSAFHEIKDKIKDSVTKVGRAVYGLKVNGDEPYYEEVIVLGHSLGSVVAYDMLNSLVNLELQKNVPASMGCADRTKLFLTFGSPLDKSAFVFRTQNTRQAEVREALASAVQPFILDYQYRPQHWYNIWSQADPISGALEYYDDQPQHPKAIKNLIDPDADVFLLAHNQYWKNPMFIDLLSAFARGEGKAWQPK